MPSARTRGTRAWLVRWDAAGEHAAVEREVAAVLPWRWSADTVGRLLEVLYASSNYEPAEMLEASRPRGHNPYPARRGTCPVILEDGSRRHVPWDGEVVCGHNPLLIARQARVWTSERGGSVEWSCSPRPTVDMRGYRGRAPLEPDELDPEA